MSRRKGIAPPDSNPNRYAVLQSEFREDLKFWVTSDRKTALRILDLIEAIMRDPFISIGKPEPLKYDLQGCWSRRIDTEHRLVYEIFKKDIRIVSCRYHY